MARSQHRYFGDLFWQSMSGNAMLAIANGLSSGKKIKIQALEARSVALGSFAGYVEVGLFRGTSNSNDGEECILSPYDTDATLPSGVQVVKNCSFTPDTNQVMHSIMWQTSTSIFPAAAQKFYFAALAGSSNDMFYSNPKKTGVESLVVRAGESAGLFAAAASTRNQVLMVRYKVLDP